MADFDTITACRACGGRYLNAVLDLGTPVLSDFVAPGAPDPPRIPLEMVQCDECSLVQLRHTTNPDLLYVKSYWYLSGVNEVMRQELDDVVRKAVQMVGGVGPQHVVCDIGANDGYLLSRYSEVVPNRPFRIAYEPALSLTDELAQHTDILMPELFPRGYRSLSNGRDVRLVTSVAVFNHAARPKEWVEAVDFMLADDGVWVMQVQDLAQMIQKTAYDNICHEHPLYPSTATFATLLDGFDLKIAAAESRAINGGSMRYYVTRRQNQHRFPRTVADAYTAEQGLDREALARFVRRVLFHKEQLVGTIDHFRSQGAEVDLYAASTKSSTLLQHCGIDRTRIRCAVERTPKKWGLETSGTRIPIGSEGAWRQDPAPVLLIGAWQFADFFKEREQEFLEAGGKMLIPLPQTELVEQKGVA